VQQGTKSNGELQINPRLRRKGDMKSLKKDLSTVTKELKALARKTERLAKAVVKLEKAQAVGKKKTKAKAKTRKKAPAKKAPRKKAPRKKVFAKKATALTATDQVLKIIKRSKKGVDAPTLIKRTGLEERSIRNILYRAFKQGKIKRTGRGNYVAA
jgi:septal ring factor EnvC (AmiA/AmiB activator)